jgi:hypothetical protein
MHTLETFDQGKWLPMLSSKSLDWLERIKEILEGSGEECRII